MRTGIRIGKNDSAEVKAAKNAERQKLKALEKAAKLREREELKTLKKAANADLDRAMAKKDKAFERGMEKKATSWERSVAKADRAFERSWESNRKWGAFR